jgi:hypothetical protein
MYEDLGNGDKMRPTLDVGDETRDSCFLCSAIAVNRFNVSVSLPHDVPGSRIIAFLVAPFRKGRFIEFGECNLSQTKSILDLWASTEEQMLEAILEDAKNRLKAS